MAEPEYAKRLFSAVLSVCDKKMFMMQRSLALLITLGRAAAFSETAFRDCRRRHRMDRGATALHGSLVGGPPSLDATEARR
jgi:hypothetical protein